jgi:hypothetical protein
MRSANGVLDIGITFLLFAPSTRHRGFGSTGGRMRRSAAVPRNQPKGQADQRQR